MQYLCKNCGNKNDFRASCELTRSVTEYCTGTVFIDAKGNYGETEVHDTNETECTGGEDVDNIGDVECNNCGEIPDEVEQEDWDSWVEGNDENQQANIEPASTKLNDLKEKLLESK